MEYLLLGLGAFLLFFLYDINQLVLKKAILGYAFFGGVFLLTASTAGILLSGLNQIDTGLFRIWFFAFLSMIFLILVIYSLFFALPFKDTYIDKKAPPKVYDKGIYALCRHPGVIFFVGFYAFLGLSLQIPLFWGAAALFSILNILYAIFQDRWTFMKLFSNYDEYRKTTPFLIPTVESIKKCSQTLKKEGNHGT